ncbi:hypothetical protein [Niveispirillum fermenti]|uniref:hypothetical protein n=1 Tax=Niveispirillum fermenti TaxID=1233113 RepID=UPI003A896508
MVFDHKDYFHASMDHAALQSNFFAVFVGNGPSRHIQGVGYGTGFPHLTGIPFR